MRTRRVIRQSTTNTGKYVSGHRIALKMQAYRWNHLLGAIPAYLCSPCHPSILRYSL
jgi:hypothetical protein